MLVNPASTFTAALEGAPTGLAGTIAVRIVNAADDTIARARQTTGIAEAIATSGTYEAQLTSPTTLGEYLIVWDDGGASPEDFASETLTIVGVAPPTPYDTPTGSSILRLPQRNSTLVEIGTRATTEDWNETTTTAAVWTGKSDAYIIVRKSRETGNQTSSQEQTRTVLLPRQLPVSIGDRLTVKTDDGTTQTLTVRTIERRIAPPGIADAPLRLTAETD